MKEISVGLFCDGYVPIMDGVTITVRNYAYWLNRKCGPACVVTPSARNTVDSDDFPVIRFLSVPTIVRPPYRIGLPDLDLNLQLVLRKRNIDIIHSHSPFGAGLVALRTAHDKGIPIVTTFHSKYREDLKRAMPVKYFVDDQIKRIVDYYYHVDHVWVPQEAVAKTLRQYGYKGPYDVVENGIDIIPPADPKPFREKGAELLGLPEGIPVGLYVGQHIFEKNLEFLLKTLPAVMAAIPDFHMVFVGQGYAKERLMEMCAELGIADHVIFHDVVYDREILKRIYARGDLFLFPSLYDNAPLVVREAAAFRTPALLIKGSTASEVIRDGENGFLAENDLEAFSARIIGILNDQDQRAAAGNKARQSLCRSWENVIEEVVSRYRKILSRWA